MGKKKISYFLNERKLKKIFQNFKRKKLLVIGDVILDKFIWGDVSRISPEAPVPVVEVEKENFASGGAGNVASNIKSLGSDVFLIGRIGNDLNGEVLKNLTRKAGVETFFIERDIPTITKTRVIGRSQQIVRIDREDRRKLTPEEMKKIKKKIDKIIDGVDGIIVSDYGKGIITMELISYLIKLKKEKGIILCVDPKVEHFMYYKNVTCITPNKKEAAEGMKENIPSSEKELLKLGRKIKRNLNCENLIITLGKDGIILFNKENRIFHIPSVAKDVYDVTGAGDTVVASFTLSYSETKDEIISSIIANFAAGIVVGKLGTATVNSEELEEFFEKNLNSEYIEIIK